MAGADERNGVAMEQIHIFSPMFDDFTEEGRNEENHWYDTDHVPQRLTIPGFRTTARFERSSVTPVGAETAPLRYLNAYLLDSPEVVAAEPYSRSYQYLTPRRLTKAFEPAIPVFRDVWSLVGGIRGHLATRDGVRTILLTADEPAADRDAALEFLDTVTIPLLLDCPGVLRAFCFERQETKIALANAAHAPRFLTAFAIASPEVATRTDYATVTADIARRVEAAGTPVRRDWTGVYDRRPSPWTTAPTD